MLRSFFGVSNKRLRVARLAFFGFRGFFWNFVVRPQVSEFLSRTDFTTFAVLQLRFRVSLRFYFCKL